MSDRTDYTTVWLCGDCTADGHNSAPLYTYEGDNLVVTGRVPLTPNFDINTEEGVHDFDKEPCDYCETYLAGERYRHALWYNDIIREGN
jgi:hypothetical protein